MEAIEENPRENPQQIPMEMVSEILNRLPLNSLAKFKCVSKPWLSLIDEIADEKMTQRFREIVMEIRNAEEKFTGVMSLHGLELFEGFEAKLEEIRAALVAYRDDMDRFRFGADGHRATIDGILDVVDKHIGQLKIFSFFSMLES